MISKAELDMGNRYACRHYAHGELVLPETFRDDARLQASVRLHVGDSAREGLGNGLEPEAVIEEVFAGRLPSLAEVAVSSVARRRAAAESLILGLRIDGAEIAYEAASDSVILTAPEGPLPPVVLQYGAALHSLPVNYARSRASFGAMRVEGLCRALAGEWEWSKPISREDLEKGNPYAERPFTHEEMTRPETFRADAALRASVHRHVADILHAPGDGSPTILSKTALAEAVFSGQLPGLALTAVAAVKRRRKASARCVQGFHLAGHELTYLASSDTVLISRAEGLDPRIIDFEARLNARPADHSRRDVTLRVIFFDGLYTLITGKRHPAGRGANEE